jgi:F420-dependent oxidoreductase-like protein
VPGGGFRYRLIGTTIPQASHERRLEDEVSRRPSLYLFLPQAALSYDMLRARARTLEALGYDGLWIVDHMWARGMPDLDFLDGWTTIAALAEATERLRLGVLVTCNSYRNPGILAKIATTADHVSGGRVELGLGAGWMEEEYRAYGFEFPPIRSRLAQLEESLEVVTSLFTKRRTAHTGTTYTFKNTPFEPKPLQSPMPITLGGSGTRVFMRLVARYAKRWNCPMPAAARLSEHLDALAAHCEAIDRDPSEVIVSEQTCVVVGYDDADYRQKRSIAQSMVGSWIDLDTMAVCGTVDRVADGLRDRMRAGVTDFAIVFGDLGMSDTLELFIREVAPRLGD